MLFGVGCNHKFYAIINCLPLHARFLIFGYKTAKNSPDLSATLSLKTEKQLKNELLKNIIN